MDQIIPIDDNARIVIDSLNYILQYKRNSRDKITWRTAGYFPDLTSLSLEYINSAPQRAENPIKTIEKLIEVVKASTDQISEILKNNN